ncbi:MAG: TetR family transcriptional regulator C-terminal domain-containing protein [Gemmatimonadetes bacterium]|nr:TetR family transcriptional regulator C-terminal domain-containing protein [Gemmatimonadota bacterium]
MEAAFNEMYMNGFRAASLDAILTATGLTKGALYHHFGSKQGLGYAVVEERVKPLVRERYLDTFRAVADPIEGLKRMGARMQQELEKKGILLMGCPVNNLVTEMSGVDEGFRRRLAEILEEWKATIAEGLRRGQASGLVRSDVDPVAVATFYVASYQGACGFAKNAHDIAPFEACRNGLDDHLESLRPQGQANAHMS